MNLDLDDLREGLEIGATGIGLVFLALVFFLLMMMALKRLFPADTPSQETPSGGPEEEEQAPGEPASGRPPIERVAAIAVSLALSMEGSATRQPGRPTHSPRVAGGLSPWRTQAEQSTIRSRGPRR